MKVTNSKHFYIPPISLDEIVKKRKDKSYSVECVIEKMSHPEKIIDGYRYNLNYNILHKAVHKKLSEDLKNCTTGTDRSLMKRRVNDIFWSIFSNLSISAPSLKAVGLISGTDDKDGYIVLARSSVNLKSSGLTQTCHTTFKSSGLNQTCHTTFNFWCSSPSHYSFLNLAIITSEKIESIKFNIDIIHCESDIYNLISSKETYNRNDGDIVNFYSRGTIKKIQSSLLTNYYNEITCSFVIPYLVDPKMCKIKVWGDDRFLDNSNFILKSPGLINQTCFTTFKEEGNGNYSDGIFSYGHTEPWCEYICTDKRKISDIKRDKKIWVMIFPQEYKPPEEIRNKYIQICNDIAEQKMLWIMYKNEQNLPVGSSNKKIISIDEIKRIEIEQQDNFSCDIMEAHRIEEREYSFEYISLDEEPDSVRIHEEEKAIRIEVDVGGTSEFHTTVFFSDKSVEQHTLSGIDIWKKYQDIMDSKTKDKFQSYTTDLIE